MVWPRTMSGDNLELTLSGQQGSSPLDGMPDCNATIPAPQLVTPAMPSPPPYFAPTILEATLPPPPDAPAVGLPSQDGDGSPPAWSPGQAMAPAPVLRLSEVIPEPVLGTDESPTMGSRNHRVGGCKPCAFLHTKGCNNGIACEFCHLCEPGEKKKRQREKRQMQRMGIPTG